MVDLLESEILKILHVTDLHFNQAQCNWVLQQCADFDLLCLTGDFLDDRYGQAKPVELQITWLKAWFATFTVPVLVCSGNHDEATNGNNWLNDLPNVYGDMSQMEFESIKFGCVPYEYEALEQFNSCDILLHHEPPAGLKVAKQAGMDYGSKALKAALKTSAIKPRWILSGHVHQPVSNVSRFRECRISNPGSIRHGAIPNHHKISL